MKTKKNYVRLMRVCCCLVVLLLSLFIGVGCKETGETSQNPAPNDYSLELNTTTVEMQLFDSAVQLTATAKVNGEKQQEAEIEWTVEDPSVVEVSNTGLVSAKGAGLTKVLAQWSGKTASCDVKVEALYLPTLVVKEKSIGLTLGADSTYKPEVFVLYSEETYEIDENSLSFVLPEGGESIISVDENGCITPVAFGETVLTIQAAFRGYNGLGMSVKIPVRVVGEKIETHIYLSEDSATTLYLNEYVFDGVTYTNEASFNYEVYLMNQDGKMDLTSNAIVTWCTSEEGIVSVNNGLLTALNAGTVLVWAEYEEDDEISISEKIEITVKPYVLLDKTSELSYLYNLNKIGEVPNAKEVFGDDFAGEISAVYQNDGESSLLKNGCLDVETLGLGKHTIILLNSEGYAYKVKTTVYSLAEDYTFAFGAGDIYYWRPEGEKYGEVKKNVVIEGREAAISANINVGDLPAGGQIMCYWKLLNPKEDLAYLLNDGYKYVKVDLYADWINELDNGYNVEMYVLNDRVEFKKAVWQTIYLDLAVFYEQYDSINLATVLNRLFSMTCAEGIKDYSLSIESMKPVIEKERVDKMVIKTESDFLKINDDLAHVYELDNDITINNSGYVTIIEKLSSVLDLNGHVLTINIPTIEQWDDNKLIGVIEENGVLKNGKIVLNYQGAHQGGGNSSRGIIANTVNGLIQDVEIYSFTSGLSGVYVALFGNGTGTFENVVVRATGTTAYEVPETLNYFGIFLNPSDTIILKNCIFICEDHVELYTYETWGTATIPSMGDYTNANNTNNIYILSAESFATMGYNVESFDGNWKISAITKLPYMVYDDFAIAAEPKFISSVEELKLIDSTTGRNYVLQNNLTIDLTDASTVFIQRLSSALDLNGFTLTLNIATYQDSTNLFISELSSKGVIKNGRIVVNYAATSNVSNGLWRGLIVDKTNGLIQNVEINITATGAAYGGYLGFFNSGSGTFENVVVNARGTSGAGAKHYRPLGIFWNGGSCTTIPMITLKNCIFLTEGEIELITYETWDGVYVPTLESIFTNTNNVNSVYATYTDYATISYNTSSYDSTIWVIDEATGIPSYKKNA